MKLILRVLSCYIWWLTWRHHSRLSHLLLHLNVHLHRHPHLVMDRHVRNRAIKIGRHVGKNTRLENLRVPVLRRSHFLVILKRRLQSSYIYCVDLQTGIRVTAAYFSYQSEEVGSCNDVSQGCVSDHLNRNLGLSWKLLILTLVYSFSAIIYRIVFFTVNLATSALHSFDVLSQHNFKIRYFCLAHGSIDPSPDLKVLLMSQIRYVGRHW